MRFGPVGPLSLTRRKCQVACGIGHHCSPWVQTSKPPSPRQDSDGALRLAQLQAAAPATSGMPASATTRTPCLAVSLFGRITAAGSREVDALVARPAPRPHVLVVPDPAQR